jgi:hypothetical protein
MYQSIFSRLSRTQIVKLLFCDELVTFYNAINDYNVWVDTKTGEVVEAPEDPCDLAILVLLALRKIRDKKIVGDTLLTKEDIKNAITDMHTYWLKLCMCSYSYKKLMAKGEKTFDEEDPKYNYTRIAQHIFINMLRVLGDVEKNDISHPCEWSNEEELKTSLLNILKHPTILDHLPTDVMAVLDREYYTLNYEEYQVEKALTSWFDIINSITEDQIDDCKAIKLFIYEALEKSTLPRWIITAIKEQLKQNIKALRNPQPTPHTITNNFNAPISNFAQEQNIDNLTTK